MNIKLDELLRAIEGARTGFVNLSTLTDEKLDKREVELLNLGRGRRCAADIIDHQLRQPARAWAPPRRRPTRSQPVVTEPIADLEKSTSHCGEGRS